MKIAIICWAFGVLCGTPERAAIADSTFINIGPHGSVGDIDIGVTTYGPMNLVAAPSPMPSIRVTGSRDVMVTCPTKIEQVTPSQDGTKIFIMCRQTTNGN